MLPIIDVWIMIARVIIQILLSIALKRKKEKTGKSNLQQEPVL